MCAFLNRNGGNIFLGVSDDGTIVGVDKEVIVDIKKKIMLIYVITIKKLNQRYI